MVVISIIGLLASIVLTSLTSARNKAKISKALETMQMINKAAYICYEGNTAFNTSGIPGSTLCAGGSTIPDISDTNFSYCGNGCGVWGTTNSTGYMFAAYSDSYSGGRKVIYCGYNYGPTPATWFGINTSYDFTGTLTCKTHNL